MLCFGIKKERSLFELQNILSSFVDVYLNILRETFITDDMNEGSG